MQFIRLVLLLINLVFIIGLNTGLASSTILPKWIDRVKGLTNLPFQGKPIIDEKSGATAFVYPYAKSDTSGSCWIMWEDEGGNIKLVLARNQLNPNSWMLSSAGYANVLPNGYQASKEKPFIYKADDKEIKLDFTNAQLNDAMKDIVKEIIKEKNGVYANVKFDPQVIRKKLINHKIHFPKELDINWLENIFREAREELGLNISKENYPQMKTVDLKIDDTPAFSTGYNARRSQNRCHTRLVWLGKVIKDKEPEIKPSDDTVDAQVVYLKDLKEKDGKVYYPSQKIEKDNKGNFVKTKDIIDIDMSDANRISLEKALKQLEHIKVQEATSVYNSVLNSNTKGKRKVKDIMADITDPAKLEEVSMTFVEKYQKEGKNQLRSRIGKEGQDHFNQVLEVAKCSSLNKIMTEVVLNKCFKR